MQNKTMQGDSQPFEMWAAEFIEMLNTAAEEAVDDAAPKQVRDMLEKTEPQKGHEKYWIPILQGLVHFPTKQMSEEANHLIRCNKLKKIWNWKKNVEGAKQIIVAATHADLPLEADKGGHNVTIAINYGRTMKELLEQLQLVKVSDQVMAELANFIISALEKKSVIAKTMTEECIECLQFKKNLHLIPDFLRRFSVLYFDEDYPWLEGGGKNLAKRRNSMGLTEDSHSVGTDSLYEIVHAYSCGKDIQDEVNDLFIKMLTYAMEEDTERIDFNKRTWSIYGEILRDVLYTFINHHVTGATAEIVIPLIPGLHRMMDDDNEDLNYYARHAISGICSSAPQLLANDDDFDRLINRYINHPDDYRLLGSITELYKHNTGVMARTFQDLIGTLGKNKDALNYLVYLIMNISEKQPQIFTRENVNALSPYLAGESYQTLVLMIWDKIAAKNPDCLLDQVDVLMTNEKLTMRSMYYIQGILSTLAVKNEKLLKPVLEFFIEWTKKSNSVDASYVFTGMKKIAEHFGREPFKPYRKDLDNLKNTAAPDTKFVITDLIDCLENRSLEKVTKHVMLVQEDVNELDERVTDTEDVIGGVVQQVELHEGEITNTKEGMANVNQRVDVVEEDIEQVKEKVEEVDMKTVSNAPTWSRDVTELLNPKSDHDWRLLASRLGYSNDDIRAWSTQSDPCMALLSEWYATHKTIEATSGVLNILQEMNRLDAAVIVENAMKKSEDVDEDFKYPLPPPVFLSYQWGHQNEVKLLQQHLEMAGYLCWMDVGQMGGGDKLFEKIDAGIRGAKVVICCVSEKYAKSPNCNREVNLAVNLHKPMIPLQMEKIAWPPVGSMGPIFSEYLYIKFYSQTGGKGGKYWAKDKFHEILMQLQYNGLVPDEKLVTKEYKNWWTPVAEEIIIANKDNKNGGMSDKKDKNWPSNEDKETFPEVFLSYQWDKQKQIQALYQRLTGLGLTCWMDIHQMGGGDSLYDKIDKGIRGCKVVLSSVTQKYALSANCRREVSLADALKKPIIPLFLEELTWPPSAPMSMVFTQLVYIDFSKNTDVQMSWKGKDFEELMNKLKDYIPVFSEGHDKFSEGTNRQSQEVQSKEQSNENSVLADKQKKNSSQDKYPAPPTKTSSTCNIL